ncbi:GNAT family N-acetyltransferase [Phaeobacter marinintestinus]|uniref:GNAT family N-acetyltransferase n=1 Tax=Falsiphaeobacter marinintestinus TaxID=1492905 RepID=UPI0011B3DEF8|nr:GNAT family N-acetyltransferase [Phaeobacter marinintestinus]
MNARLSSPKLRKATEQDAELIDAYLAQHAATSMYLRGNLSTHGVGFTDHPLSTEFHLWEPDGLAGVFGITRSGYLMAQVPGMPEEAAQAFAQVLAGVETLGMTGVTNQVTEVLRALDLETADYQMRHIEPLFLLDLSDLPTQPETCRPMHPDDLAIMEPWFADYLFQTGQFDAENARQKAPERARIELASGRVRVVEDGGQPVAMATLNAVVGHHAQVGGVFVPDKFRKRGLGRRVTIAVLQDARAEGVQVANLFANSPDAARLYEKIGFKQIGWYSIALLARPYIINGGAA